MDLLREQCGIPYFFHVENGIYTLTREEDSQK